MHGNKEEWQECLEWSERSVRMRESKHGPDHALAASALGQMAIVYGQLGDPEKEMALQLRVLGIQEEASGWLSREVAQTCSNIGISHCNAGRHSEAVGWFKRAVEASEYTDGLERSETMEYRRNLMRAIDEMAPKTMGYVLCPVQPPSFAEDGYGSPVGCNATCAILGDASGEISKDGSSMVGALIRFICAGICVSAPFISCDLCFLGCWLGTGFWCCKELPCAVRPVDKTFERQWPCLVVAPGAQQMDRNALEQAAANQPVLEAAVEAEVAEVAELKASVEAKEVELAEHTAALKAATEAVDDALWKQRSKVAELEGRVLAMKGEQKEHARGRREMQREQKRRDKAARQSMRETVEAAEAQVQEAHGRSFV
jgi:tetratricopeptide (TPR) repeat protein